MVSRDLPINRIASCVARRTLGTLPVNDSVLRESRLAKVEGEDAEDEDEDEARGVVAVVVLVVVVVVVKSDVKDSRSILSPSRSSMAESKAWMSRTFNMLHFFRNVDPCGDMILVRG